MKNPRLVFGWLAATAVLASVLSGCVERKLTIITEPEGATVWLNDEEIGQTPATVNFNWYGDYRIRIEKPGYAAVSTHRDLPAPWYDRPGLDFIAQILWPGQIVDAHTWEFHLEPYQPPTAEQLLQQASALKQQTEQEVGKIAVSVLKDEAQP